MALSYPYTATFTSAAQTLEFTDGMTIVVKAGTFGDTVIAIIGCIDGCEIRDEEPFSSCYTIAVTSGTPPSPLTKVLGLYIPTRDTIGAIEDLTLWRNPNAIPYPDHWCPVPDASLAEAGSQLVTAKLDKLETFQLTIAG